MHSTIAIIQSDAHFGDQLSRTLRQDGHEVLPVAHTIEDAYKNFSVYNANIAVIDGTLPKDTVIRLSDMFTLMDVPHIINYNDELILRRSTVNNTPAASRPGMLEKQVQPPMTHAISLAVWELHVSLQISKPVDALSPAFSYI